MTQYIMENPKDKEIRELKELIQKLENEIEEQKGTIAAALGMSVIWGIGLVRNIVLDIAAKQGKMGPLLHKE